MGDYGYQILQELRTQGDVLDALNSKLSTVSTNLGSALSTLNSQLETLNNLLTIASLIAVIGFGIFAFMIIMKWVKK